MIQEFPKLSSGPDDSEASDSSGSMESVYSSSGSVESSSGSLISDSGGSGGSDASDESVASSLDSVSSGSSNSSSGSSGLVSGNSDDVVISYRVFGVIVVSYAPGWNVVWMMEAQKTGASLVHEDGDSSGGLTCEWNEFPPPNSLESAITGDYSTSEQFMFRFMESEAETSVAARNLAVQNTGDNDIRVQTDGGLIDVVVSPGDSFYLAESESVSNPWVESSFLFNVSAA